MRHALRIAIQSTEWSSLHAERIEGRPFGSVAAFPVWWRRQAGPAWSTEKSASFLEPLGLTTADPLTEAECDHEQLGRLGTGQSSGEQWKGNRR